MHNLYETGRFGSQCSVRPKDVLLKSESTRIDYSIVVDMRIRLLHLPSWIVLELCLSIHGPTHMVVPGYPMQHIPNGVYIGAPSF